MKDVLRLFIVLFAISLFFSCAKKDETSGTEATAETVLIDMMVYANEGMLNNYQSAIDKFHMSQDRIRINLENICGEDWSDYEFALRSRILSGNAPDIVDVSVVYRDALIRDGLLLDIMPYFKQSGIDFDNYFDNQFEGLRDADSLYGIPSGALLMAAYINKDLFRKAGVDIPDTGWESTWSWSEFASAARQIRELSDAENEVYGMTMSFTIGWLIPFLMTNGAEFLIENSAECTAGQPEAVESFAFMKKLMFEEGTSPDMMKLISLQPYQYFFDGNVGIFIDGNWWMEAAAENAEFDWGVCPLPVSKYPATGMYVDSWAVTAASDNPAEAFELLRFFLQEDQQHSGIMKGIPALKSAARNIYKNRFPSLDDEEIDVWFNGITYGATPAYFYGWNNFQNETTEILRHYSFGEFSAESLTEQLCGAYVRNRQE